MSPYGATTRECDRYGMTVQRDGYAKGRPPKSGKVVATLGGRSEPAARSGAVGYETRWRSRSPQTRGDRPRKDGSLLAAWLAILVAGDLHPMQECAAAFLLELDETCTHRGS